MRLLKVLLLLAAIAAVAAWATRPGEAAFEAMLDQALRERLAAADLAAVQARVPALALAACKLRPGDCAALLREAITVRHDRRLFTTRVTVEGLGREASCLGLFGRFFCRRTLFE